MNFKRILTGLSTVTMVLALAMPTSTLAQGKDFVFYGVSVEQSEFRYRLDDESNLVTWDGEAFVGTDTWKLRLQSEGERVLRQNQFETLEHQLSLQMPISQFFDFKGGLRSDSLVGPDRWYAVAGVHGLAPQWFEIDADLFLSRNGELSARLDVDYELLITNRLILTPTAEINVGFTSDTAIGKGSGLRVIELGLRLSYDLIDRAVAPYIGVAYEREFGKTAAFSRADGEDVDALFIVAGIRFLF